MKSKIKFENLISAKILYSDTSNEMSNKKGLELERLFLNRINQSIELIKTSESGLSKTKSAETIVTTIKDMNNNRTRACNNTTKYLNLSIQIS